MKTDSTTQKIDAFRQALLERGESVADYCRRRGLDYEAMYMVLRGRSKGRRGKAHAIYVALGLKKGARPSTKGQTA